MGNKYLLFHNGCTLLVFSIAFSRYHIKRKNTEREPVRLSYAYYGRFGSCYNCTLLLLVILVIAEFDLNQDDILDVKALVTIFFTGVIGLLLMVEWVYEVHY